MNRLAEPLSDDLVEVRKNGIMITKKGKLFLRNVCLAFDLRLWANQPETRIFSMAV
jgi:oxygen-independent coproporphyrinogen-3 oxidase